MVSKMTSTSTGASPIEGSSSSSRVGLPSSARATASICCSPPDMVPAFWLIRSRSRGNSSSTRSRSSAIFAVSLRVYAPRSRFSDTVIRWKILRPSGDWQMPSLTTSWPGMPLMRPALEDDLARRRPQQAGDGAQRGRLAGAVGPDQGHDLAGVDDEVQLLHGGDVAVVDADALQLEDHFLALAARLGGRGLGSTLMLLPLAFAGAGLAEVGLDHLLVVADVVGRAFGDHRARGRAR